MTKARDLANAASAFSSVSATELKWILKQQQLM